LILALEAACDAELHASIQLGPAAPAPVAPARVESLGEAAQGLTALLRLRQGEGGLRGPLHHRTLVFRGSRSPRNTPTCELTNRALTNPAKEDGHYERPNVIGLRRGVDVPSPVTRVHSRDRDSPCYGRTFHEAIDIEVVKGRPDHRTHRGRTNRGTWRRASGWSAAPGYPLLKGGPDIGMARASATRTTHDSTAEHRRSRRRSSSWPGSSSATYPTKNSEGRPPERKAQPGCRAVIHALGQA